MTVASYSATLVQYVVYARTLGVGRDTDALAIVLAWAAGLAGLIATTLTGVALPPFVRERFSDPDRAQGAFRSAVALAIGAAVVVAFLTAIGGQTLAAAMSPAAEVQRPVAGLLIATAVLILAWTGVGILVALANATEHYGQAAASGIAPSAVVAGALILGGPATPDLAIRAFVAGALVQMAWLAWVVRRDLGVVIPLPDWSQMAVLARRCVPVALMLLLFNGAMLLARALATSGDLGDVAVFDYAARLVLAGQQVLLAGVLAVALTKWSQKAGTDTASNPQIGRTIAVALGLVIPAATALAILAPEVIDLLLTGGRFGSEDATRVAGTLRWMAPGIAAQMVLLLGFRALTAYQHLWPMAGIGLAHVVTLIAVAAVAQPALGVDGIGVAYSCSWIIGVALTLIALKPLIERDAGIGRQALATTIATLAAGLIAAFVLGMTPAGHAVRLGVGVAVFVGVGWAVGYVAGVEFVRSATRRVVMPRPTPA